MSTLIKTDQLLDWFECKQPAKLMRILRERNIPFHLNAIGNPITTDEAINASLKNTQQESQVDF